MMHPVNFIFKKNPRCLGWVSDCTNERCWPEMTAALPQPNGTDEPNKQATAASDRVGKTNLKTSRFWGPTSGETTQHGLNDENNMTWMWPSYNTLVTQAASKKHCSWHCGGNLKKNSFPPLCSVLVSCAGKSRTGRTVSMFIYPWVIWDEKVKLRSAGRRTSDIWLDDNRRYGRDGDIPSIIIHCI